MARKGRGRAAELSESWDDVSGDYSEEDCAPTSDDEDERQTRRNTLLNRANGDVNGTPKRATRSSVEPELVMPSSPDALKIKQRAKTPHFRLNQRSMTSDAGELDAGRKATMAERTQTPRFRMNQRSMTSDAGALKRGASAMQDGDEYDDTVAGYLDMAWRRIFGPILRYIAEIVGMVLQNAKPLLAYGIFAYLVVAALIFGSGFLTNSINHALSPICRIPGVNTIFHPSFCPTTQSTQQIQGAAEFDKLVQAQSAFDEVLVASSAGINLPADMSRSASSIRDLRQVVRHSTLPSKLELENEFDGFVQTARQASDDLSKFNTHIGGAVDRILSINRWTLSTISGVQSREDGRGTLSAFFHDHLNIFSPFLPVQLSRDILLDQYLRHTEAVEEKILALIDEAFALLAILENLDDRLDVIGDIATRDGLKAESSKDELLSHLWTFLGGNRSSMSKLQRQIDLLNSVGAYRKIAWAHVNGTILKLQAIRAQLEDLRERVAGPEVLGSEKVPLEVHIGSINLGIERLEEQRDRSREAVMRGYRDAVGRAENAGEKERGKMIGGREL